MSANFLNGILGSATTSIQEKISIIQNEVPPIKKSIVNIEEELTNFHCSLKTVYENQAKTLDYVNEVSERIEKYVSQQLLNNKILNLYIEKELLLSHRGTAIALKQARAMAIAPWWKKITKKQREKILTVARESVVAEYEEKLSIVQEKLKKATEEQLQMFAQNREYEKLKEKKEKKEE